MKREAEPVFVDPFSVEGITLQITNRCNLKCLHCCFESGPLEHLGPSLSWIFELVEKVAETDISRFMITGGEPFLRQKTLLLVVENIAKYGMKPEVTTNGFWASSDHQAEDILNRLADVGVSKISVSIDRFHAKHISLDCYKILSRLIQKNNYPFEFRIFSLTEPHGRPDIIKEFETFMPTNLEITVQPVVPFGRARKCAKDIGVSPYAPDASNAPCHWVLTPFIDANLQWHICCMSPCVSTKSQLQLGTLSHPKEFHKFLDKHLRSPLFRALRALGPRMIMDFVQKFSDKIIDGEGCELCLYGMQKNQQDLNKVLQSSEFCCLLDNIEDIVRKKTNKSLEKF